MPIKSFSDRWLASVGPFAATREFVDGACPNLRVRIGKRRKSFSVMIGSAASRRRISLGVYPTMSLAEARKRAGELSADPRAAGGGRPRRGGRAKMGTVADLFEFVVRAMADEGKNASIKDYRIYLLDGADAAVKDFGPTTLARNVTPEMVTDWLAKFHERQKSTRLPRAVLSAAFNRGLKADNDPTSVKDRRIHFGLDRNPVALVGGPTQSNRRDRSLTFEEMRDFWRYLSDHSRDTPVTAALRMIIAMGGVRVTEIANSKASWWREEGDWRTMKAPRLALPKTKNGHPHDLPVTRAAWELVTNVKASLQPHTTYLFPSPYKTNSPRTIDAYAKAVLQYLNDGEVTPFTLRDIRRSMKNILLDDDVPQVEVDIWHNHGRNADVARRNYDRAQYEHAKGRVRCAIDLIIDKFSERLPS